VLAVTGGDLIRREVKMVLSLTTLYFDEEFLGFELMALSDCEKENFQSTRFSVLFFFARISDALFSEYPLLMLLSLHLTVFRFLFRPLA